MAVRGPPSSQWWARPYVDDFLRRLHWAASMAPNAFKGFHGVGAITCTSWFRTPDQNRKAGGSEESQHLYALAADYVGDDLALEGFSQYCWDAYLESYFGAENLHVQMYPAGTLARAGWPFPP